MSMNYIGAKRKRTNTPAANRKRAVEYRHRPYKVKKPVIEEIQEPVLSAFEELPAQEESEAVIEEVKEVITEEPAEELPAETKEDIIPDAPAVSPVTNEVNKAAAAAATAAAAAGSFFKKTFSSVKGLFAKKETKAPAEPEVIPAVNEEPPEPEVSEAQAEESIAAIGTDDILEINRPSETEVDLQETEEESAEVVLEETGSDEQVELESEEQPEELPEVDTAEVEDEAGEAIELAETDLQEETPAEVTEEVTEETAETETAEEETSAEESVSEAPVFEPAEEEIQESEPAEETQIFEAVKPEEETEVIEPVTPEETEAEPAETAEETQFIDIPQEPVKEPEVPMTKKEKRAEKKAIRKETKIQLIDEKIDAPKAGLLTMLLMPGRAMTRVSSVEKTTLSIPSVFILNLIKWISVGAFFAVFFERFINQFNYSFIRMNFTGTASLAFRFGVFGLIAEYLCYMIIGIFCGLIRRKISTLKLMEVESRSAPAVALLFAAGCALVYFGYSAFGCAAAAAGMAVGFITKGYGLDRVLTIGKNTQLVLVMVLTAAVTVAAFSYFPLTVSGLIDIFKTILHL
ncbi:MAG: hypothetical protein IJ252_11805 [Solobacterium sp.]|nr:hypothetical protein [Solobacterium sp.]